MIVHTKQNKHGNWWCNFTWGYDYSFEHSTIQGAQQLAIDSLKSKGIHSDDIKWMEPLYYVAETKYPKPQIGYQRVRLDFLR